MCVNGCTSKVWVYPKLFDWFPIDGNSGYLLTSAITNNAVISILHICHFPLARVTKLLEMELLGQGVCAIFVLLDVAKLTLQKLH